MVSFILLAEQFFVWCNTRLANLQAVEQQIIYRDHEGEEQNGMYGLHLVFPGECQGEQKPCVLL